MNSFNYVFALIVIAIQLLPNIVQSSLEQDGWLNIDLKHALVAGENPIFTDRGNVSIQSIRLGQGIITQNSLTAAEQTQLRDLAAANELYQIRAIVTAKDGKEKTFLSTIKACMLAEAKLDDRLSVSVDYQGNVIGVSLVVASKSTCEGARVPLSQLKDFTTSLYVRHSESGPIPDTATYIQRLEREREAKERGEGKDNRSFLAKYWMYIVPVVILMVISSAASPEGGQG